MTRNEMIEKVEVAKREFGLEFEDVIDALLLTLWNTVGSIPDEEYAIFAKSAWKGFETRYGVSSNEFDCWLESRI